MCHGNGILEMKNFHFSYNGVLDLDIPSLSIPAELLSALSVTMVPGKQLLPGAFADWRGKLLVRLV